MHIEHLVLKKLTDDADSLDFDNYWDVVSYNFDLADTELWVEFARQWLVIFSTVAISALFVYSLIRLRKTQNGCDIDQIILVAELVKINLFAIFTFFLLLYAGIVLCSVMQSMIRTGICSVFLFRYIHQSVGSPKLARFVFLLYLLALLGFDFFLSVNIFLANGEDCTPSTDWQILALISVDTIQSVLLLTVTLLMYKQAKGRERTQSVLSSGRSRDRGV
mmetsp:Transcript_2536/g.3521  ORF Transcript_2536/g.3521 Transcript_2536/m.3521 type:complete len:220 (+) Transcript_2536:25-684(+)